MFEVFQINKKNREMREGSNSVLGVYCVRGKRYHKLRSNSVKEGGQERCNWWRNRGSELGARNREGIVM